MERKFVADNCDGWTRDAAIFCKIDTAEFVKRSSYHYKYGEWIEFTSADKGWDDEAILHEYAHAIHNAAYEGNIYFGPEDHPNHEIDSVTNQYFAFCEGWAEFMSAIVPDDTPYRVGGWYINIEDNDWWKGSDETNEDGSLVEGAVASALYDMQDDCYDSVDEYNQKYGYPAGLSDLFYDIFRIFRQGTPATIVDFARLWYNDDLLDDTLRGHMVAIHRNHSIPTPYHAGSDFVPSPRSFSLSQNYPNPFNSQTTIDYHIPSRGMVNLAIYNILGQKVKTCVNEKKIPGFYTYIWDGKNDKGSRVASGVYIYRMSFEDKKVSKLMVLLK